MQLDEFVRTTLSQIAKGVADAADELKEKDVVMCPRLQDGYGDRKETEVVFDVALTVSDSSSGEAGGKVSVASIFGINGKITESDTRQETSRVQFSIRMHLPCGEERQPGLQIGVKGYGSRS